MIDDVKSALRSGSAFTLIARPSELKAFNTPSDSFDAAFSASSALSRMPLTRPLTRNLPSSAVNFDGDAMPRADFKPSRIDFPIPLTFSIAHDFRPLMPFHRPLTTLLPMLAILPGKDVKPFTRFVTNILAASTALFFISEPN